MANSPTYYRDEATVTARKAEVPNADFDGGVNICASCAEGIGIATDEPDLAGNPEQWTLLDQDGAARTPQVGQHIGGDGSTAGVAGKGTTAIRVATPSTSGDGTVTDDGDAHLTDLATGWSAV